MTFKSGLKGRESDRL